MAVAKKSKALTIPKFIYAVALFRDGEFYELKSFGFDRRAAKAFAGGVWSLRSLSAELIEVPLIPEQVAEIESAVERVIEAEAFRGFRQ